VKKEFMTAVAIFDTGAHTKHIDTAVLQRLGYDLNTAEKSYINTVGSRDIAINNTVIDNIKLGNFETGAASVNFSDISDLNFPVILGLNILKEFNINLDFEKSLIIMKPNFDERNKITAEQFNKYYSRFGIWTIYEQKYF
jgi:hypothetical protein